MNLNINMGGGYPQGINGGYGNFGGGFNQFGGGQGIGGGPGQMMQMMMQMMMTMMQMMQGQMGGQMGGQFGGQCPCCAGGGAFNPMQGAMSTMGGFGF